jgi:uncharacterized protein YecE (DUF72 family)
MVTISDRDDAKSSLFTGCPVWACRQWQGNFFPKRTRPSEFLGRYSAIFNSVEGNSVFYGMPRRETVFQWAEDTPEGFQFTFKFPRVISHELGLRQSREETGTFLSLMEPLAERGRLGPLLLQLPPLFSPGSLGDLKSFLERLPRDFEYGLEVRHWGWYDGEADEDSAESRLNRLLRQHRINRVHLDSRPLNSLPAEDPAEAAAQQRKPRLPFRKTVTGRHPVIRIVGRNHIEQVQPWLEAWARITDEWLNQGLQPFLFFHTPSDRYAPDLARLFHGILSELRPDLSPLEMWPGEVERLQQPRQLEFL